MRASETYKLIDREGSDLYGVKITSGVFSGTIYTYGKVSFREGDNDIPILAFQFNIESSPLPAELLKSLPAFKNLIGDILHDILEAKYLIHDRHSGIPVDNSG